MIFRVSPVPLGVGKAEDRIAKISEWCTMACQTIEGWLSEELMLKPSFLASAGGHENANNKKRELMTLVEMEVASAIKVMYNEAVSEEIRVFLHNSNLLGDKGVKRKLEATGCCKAR